MPLHIPARQGPTRITVGDAFGHLVQQTLKADSAIGRAGDLAAAVHFASARIFQRGLLTAAQAARTMPQLDFLDTDPIDIALTILDGIASGKLSVQGLPEGLMSTWVARPFVTDWATGAVAIGSDMRGPQFCYPSLDRAEVDALFSIGRESKSSSDQIEAIAPAAGPVSRTALAAVVVEIMKAERVTEAQAREHAVRRLAPRIFSDASWRAAWKNAPNKLRRGEKPTGKSGA